MLVFKGNMKRVWLRRRVERKCPEKIEVGVVAFAITDVKVFGIDATEAFGSFWNFLWNACFWFWEFIRNQIGGHTFLLPHGSKLTVFKADKVGIRS